MAVKSKCTMDFFDRETRARKQTRRLIWLFGLAVLMLLVVNNLLLGMLASAIFHPIFSDRASFSPLNMAGSLILLGFEAPYHPWHFLKLVVRWPDCFWISLVTLVTVAGGCYYKIRELSAGGSVVAELLGGRRVTPQSDDLDEQRLRNVVAEMAIASGLPVPEIYLLDNERGINAFSAGHTRDDVAIGVTRGCVKLLTRDELQGVIAHEFSHILNGDTRLNMKLMGLAHGLFWPTLLGRVLIYGSPEPPPLDNSFLVESDQKKTLPTAPLGFLFVIMGSVSLPFVRLIKGAICRQREWLADAAAVQFTRSPAGITGALKKVGGLFKQGRLDAPGAEVASHLYFASSAEDPWFYFLATHPPLGKRIGAIDPSFDGNFPHVQMLAPNQYERDQAFEQYAQFAAQVAPMTRETSLWPDAVSADHIRQASLMRQALPGEVQQALATAAGAAGIVYALLMSDDDDTRARQMDVMRSALDPAQFAQASSLVPPVQALGDKYKLLLAEFAVPALREYNRDEHDAFHQTMQRLVEVEGSIGLFEYAITKMVAHRLRARTAGLKPRILTLGRVQDLLPECTVLLSALAYVACDNEAEARTAFTDGVGFLDAPGVKLQFLTRPEWDLARVDAALQRLTGYHDPLKRNVLMACARTVIGGGQEVSVRALELLRAIADSLDCPMPPLIEKLRTEDLARGAAGQTSGSDGPVTTPESSG